MYLRHILTAMLLALTLGTSASAQVSVSIGQPGFYGRVDIGGFAPPPLIYAEPMIIRPARVAYPPLYLRVPPGHAKKWHRYCDRYRACGRPVYFVQDDWYRNEYAPVYRERHHHHHHDRHEYRSGYRDGYRDHDRHEERGDRGDRGHGHGHGHGRGRDRD